MYDKSTLTVQQLTQAVTDSVVGYKDSAKQAAETVCPTPEFVTSPPIARLLSHRMPACRLLHGVISSWMLLHLRFATQ